MEMFIIAALVGVVVGILSGLLGIGGGVIMVPLFSLGFGLEPIMATATSLFAIIPTSLSGAVKHARNKTLLPRVGILTGVVGAFLSPVGVWAATQSPDWLIMAAAAAVVLYSSITMFKKALAKSKKKKEAAPAAQTTESSGIPAIKLTPKFCAQVAAIGIAAGFLSGYVGVGGGFIMVPLFVSLLGVPMRLASGTSLTAVCILAIPGVVEQAILGNVNYAIGIAMVVGSMPGAVVGANLVKRVPERALRLLFASFLLVVAVVMLLNETGVLG